jgi:cation diffusion facilitator CzcD-associated flavoprotein CzcO
MPGSRCDAVIVGAGLAGLYQLYKLRGLGLDVRVFEAGGDVGGTWYWNRYPGARCDVESLSYSYSFSPELEQEWTWTEKYPTQPEILCYINHVAERFDLRRSITFNTRVTGASYDETAKRWHLACDTGESVTARFVIMATGCLSVPKVPEVPGADTSSSCFRGPIYHTGHWPHEGVDFTGQRVGVIGTGSSGVQAIPLLAEQASELTVFQRTPNFSIPAGNRPLGKSEIAERKANYRAWRQAQRESTFGTPRQPATQSALVVSEQERNAAYQAGWERGTVTALLSCYTDTLTNLAANETAAEFVRAKIREKVDDPQIAEMLSPRSHPYGTKRPCLDAGYYETFNKDHVHLVDLRRTALEEITPTGVRTSEKHYEFDSLVFATGFDAMTGALNAIDIRGKGGLTLRKKWEQGPHTYLGIAMAGFPNLFIITGPGSPSVLSNMIVSIEQHVEWITDCISHLRRRNLAEIDPEPEAEDAWMRHVAEVGSHTLYPTADSWYMGANVPGKPRIFMAYIGGVAAYRQKCDEVAANGYEGFVLTGSSSQG